MSRSKKEEDMSISDHTSSSEEEDEDSSPPRAKKRHRSDHKPLPTKICNHESLYFNDGNIVLVSLPAEKTITAFKVYRDCLVLHSSVFKAMLQAVPPSSNSEKYDHVPLIRLQDVAVDLIPFLRAIYDPTAVPSKRDFYFDFESVSSTFSLCKKYKCDKLLQCLQNTLSAIWPQHLASWDGIVERSKEATELPEEYILRSTLPDPCSAIHLARDYSVPEILPAAFYHLSRVSPQNLTDIDPTFRKDWGIEFDPTPQFTRLKHDDFMCLVHGFCSIRKFLHGLYNTTPANKCKRNCPEALPFLKTRDGNFESFHRDALWFLQEENIRHALTQGSSGACDQCLVQYPEWLKKTRVEFWNSLPAFFDLDSEDDHRSHSS